MIFRRRKQSEVPAITPVMRTRESVDKGDNPLARRFHPEDEPDTIDLAQSSGFPDEPDTSERKAEKSLLAGLGLITLVEETGKMYAQPGTGNDVVYLGDEPILAPTELRPGDRVRVGELELRISKIP